MIPPLAELLTGKTLMLDPAAIAGRLLAIVGGAALTSLALRRLWPALVNGQTMAMTGIGVVALLVFAAGAVAGMQSRLLANPVQVLACLGLAFVVNAGLQISGAVLFARAGRAAGLTVGLVSGNRNIGLVWAATGKGLPPFVETYWAMSVLPIYMLPMLSQPLVANLLTPRQGRPTPAAVPRG